jgi:hypothetical protein
MLDLTEVTLKKTSSLFSFINIILNFRVYFILLISFCEFTLNIVVYINIFS